MGTTGCQPATTGFGPQGPRLHTAEVEPRRLAGDGSGPASDGSRTLSFNSPGTVSIHEPLGICNERGVSVTPKTNSGSCQSGLGGAASPSAPDRFQRISQHLVGGGRELTEVSLPIVQCFEPTSANATMSPPASEYRARRSWCLKTQEAAEALSDPRQSSVPFRHGRYHNGCQPLPNKKPRLGGDPRCYPGPLSPQPNLSRSQPARPLSRHIGFGMRPMCAFAIHHDNVAQTVSARRLNQSPTPSRRNR